MNKKFELAIYVAIAYISAFIEVYNVSMGRPMVNYLIRNSNFLLELAMKTMLNGTLLAIGLLLASKAMERMFKESA